MAGQTHSNVRVGILIAIGLVLFAFAALSIGHGTRLFAGSENFEAHFVRINGLQTGAQVTLRGVRVGAVESIRFPDNPHDNYVIVRLWIDKTAAPRVHEDSTARISSLGLLGDKFVVLTAGSPTSPAAPPGAILPSLEPFDYNTLLERQDTSDTVANIVAISQSLRSLTEAINHGNGFVHELFYGAPSGSTQQTLTLESLRNTVDSAQRTATDLDRILQQVNGGKGVLGALVSQQGDGRRLVANLQTSAASLSEASQRMNTLVTRYQNANGAIPQLMENQRYAQQVMDNLQRSSADLEQILHKINTGQGTIGKLVNDPGLYNSAQKLVGAQGWGVTLMKGLYAVFHPLSSTEVGTTIVPAAQTETQPATASEPMSLSAPASAAARGSNGATTSPQ
jgi:phospholipid/cholesterol/gamma-HCH transport system substrate-binding protein